MHGSLQNNPMHSRGGWPERGMIRNFRHHVDEARGAARGPYR